MGRISIARTHRGSVMPEGVTRLSHASCDCAGIVKGYDLMIMSGSFCPNMAAKFHPWSSGQDFGAGIAFGSPCGAPASTHLTIVSISLSEIERSFLNFWTPTVLSMSHGGMVWSATRVRIARAHGRTSWYVTSDMGAIESGR